MPAEFNFTFGSYPSKAVIRQKIPELSEIPEFSPSRPCLALYDEHTGDILRRITGAKTEKSGVYTLLVPSGEQNKSWNQAERILKEARRHGLGRDGLFLAVGGGVLCDLCAFAASLYMRGASLALAPTTLLAMADAALGGKTGVDFEGIKNCAGTFYPASGVYMAMETLETLPEREWKSGMAEIIKSAILDTEGKTLELLQNGSENELRKSPYLEELLNMAVRLKGSIVETDPRETGGYRALLNLGHTFGHALESACGLGKLSHGEAVAWGIARSCELGLKLGLTPPERCRTIMGILASHGYSGAPRFDGALFRKALINDKKKKDGALRFVVPNAESAELVPYGPEIESYLKKLCGVPA